MTSSTTSSTTSLPLALALGETPPRIRHCPSEGDTTKADKVPKFSRACGLGLDPWQRDTIRDAMKVDPGTGLWLTPRVAVSVPRQNGKGAIIEAIEVAFLLGAFPEARLLIHSAHEFKTAKNGFERILSLVESNKTLAQAKEEGRLKAGISTAREFVSYTDKKGVTRTIKFLARSKGSGRGFSADILILDEAQELAEDVFAAILPTVSARPNPQIWLFGTPPSPTMNGEVFTRFRDVALEGKDDRLAYFEWSAGPDDAYEEPATWALCNPAFPARIAESSIRDEFYAMDEETFCRERLGQWDGVASLRVIPEDTWSAQAGESDPVGRVAFAIDISPDRSRASIGVAGWIGEDQVMVQAIDNRKGTGWLVPRLVELTARWPHSAVVLDLGGPAASLLPDLKRAKVRRVLTISTRDVASATGSFYDAVMQGRLWHPDQPVLNDALAVARKRPLGEAWAWHRKNTSADITPLVAVTFAAYGLSLKPSGPAKPARVLVL